MLNASHTFDNFGKKNQTCSIDRCTENRFYKQPHWIIFLLFNNLKGKFIKKLTIRYLLEVGPREDTRE